MLTVNSPVSPMNSLVPSSGSTSQNRRPPSPGAVPAATASSATTGVAGSIAASAATISASASRSATVTGDESGLRSTATPVR